MATIILAVLALAGGGGEIVGQALPPLEVYYPEPTEISEFTPTGLTITGMIPVDSAITSIEAAEAAYRVYIGTAPWTPDHIAPFRLGPDGAAITAYDGETPNELRVTTPSFTPPGWLDTEVVSLDQLATSAILYDAVEVLPWEGEAPAEPVGEEEDEISGDDFDVEGDGDSTLFPLDESAEGEGEVEGELLLLESGGLWVDFSYSGAELGTFAQPYNTLAEAAAAAQPAETVNIVTGQTSETLTLADPLVLDTYAGAARIGVTGAVYLPLQLDITITGLGTVSKDPDLPAYTPGTTVWLTPQPGANRYFRNWDGDATGAGSPYPVYMDRHRRVTAIFASGAYSSPVIISEIYVFGTGQPHGWHTELETNPWIELYNRGASAVNLAGWSLTADVTLPGMWVLPDVTLPVGGYLVVVASGTSQAPPATQYHHTNFTLDRDGNYLALYSNDVPKKLASEFSPAFPELTLGFSISRNPENGTLEHTASPTPNALHIPSNLRAAIEISPSQLEFGEQEVEP